VPDVYLYAGEVNPGDVVLHDPLVPRGTFAGKAGLDQAQNLSARDVLLPWGVILYPMGALIPSGSGGFVGAPVHPYVQSWRLA
jgi:hypothetical protein